MHIGKSILTVLLLLLVAVAGSADPKPVTWEATLMPADIRAGEGGELVVKATIQPGWHIYSLTEIKGGPVPTAIELEDNGPLTGVGDAVQPAVPPVLDPGFGRKVERFEHAVSFGVPVAVNADLKGPQTAKLKIKYQVCNAKSCMPPTTLVIPIAFTPAAGPPRVDHTDAIGAIPPQDPTSGLTGGSLSNSPGPEASGTDATTNQIDSAQQKGLLPFVALCFGGGLLALLTPCVFPMIPITVSYFTKRQEKGRSTGIRDATAYCLGIISAFTGLGLIMTAIFGAGGLQKLATSPIVNLAFAILFIILAANLLGLFEIVLPYQLTAKFDSGRQRGGFLGPLLMGMGFTLTTFTCTSAFVGTLLARAALGGKLYPALGMLAFSTAFAMPFFLLALFPQYLARLPKSGSWLAAVKAYMGFIELAAAVKFLSNADLVWNSDVILTRGRFLGIWAVIMAAAGLYLLGALPLKGHDRTRIGWPRRTFGVLNIAVGLLFLISIPPGHSLQGLEAFLPPEKSNWLQDYDKALAQAQQEHKPVFINFTGVTCTNCRWMEHNIFTRQDVKDSLKGYVLVELYTDRTHEHAVGDAHNRDLEQKLTNTVTLPVYVSVSPEGKPAKVFQGSTPDAREFINFLKEGRQLAIASR